MPPWQHSNQKCDRQPSRLDGDPRHWHKGPSTRPRGSLQQPQWEQARSHLRLPAATRASPLSLARSHLRLPAATRAPPLSLATSPAAKQPALST